MNTNKWIRQEIFGGVQTVWSIEDNNKVCIVRDRRKEDNYPYRLEVNGKYEGDYRRLSVAKKDAIIYMEKS